MDVVVSNLGWLSWIIFGALAGWVASLITGNRSQTGCLTNIIVGIVGAFLGGCKRYHNRRPHATRKSEPLTPRIRYA
jgi:hypothetical protein